jgi:hypothetical protein
MSSSQKNVCLIDQSAFVFSFSCFGEVVTPTNIVSKKTKHQAKVVIDEWKSIVSFEFIKF